MSKMTYEKFESALDDLVRWGIVRAEVNENGKEVYYSTGLEFEDLDCCEECGLPLPQTSKQ